ncbi:MAG: type II toxin-antitoxin system RelE/ParE family toxin [Bacteroidetes bacterium]|nr:type II toxin-antitoxin system RelE/ParE family toxin [Bacteroidota bacterium]MBL6943598.1 type II toxin-antitoxin system RelE/ParE family toxin [Bacteroidales bacterium]
MKNQSYKISEKAIEDLENIWTYTLHSWSIEQADRYYNLIINEIEFITKNFMIGKSMDHTKNGYRASIVKSHLIFYRKSQDNQVEVIRILHQRMDIETIINE